MCEYLQLESQGLPQSKMSAPRHCSPASDIQIAFSTFFGLQQYIIIFFSSSFLITPVESETLNLRDEMVTQSENWGARCFLITKSVANNRQQLIKFVSIGNTFVFIYNH